MKCASYGPPHLAAQDSNPAEPEPRTGCKMLKFEIDTIEGLDNSISQLYDKHESGKYRLKIEGLPADDSSGLKKKVDELLSEKKAASAKAKEAEESARIAAEEAARKSGDIDALDRSWNKKHADAVAAKDAELSGLRGTLNTLLVDNVASQIANDLAIQGASALLLPHIKGRLSVEIRDGQPKTVVIGTDGKPSALTIEELKTEFAANPAFAPVIAGSKASGGGASGGKGGGGGAVKTVTRTQFGQMDPHAQMEHVKSGGKIT